MICAAGGLVDKVDGRYSLPRLLIPSTLVSNLTCTRGPAFMPNPPAPIRLIG